MLKRSSENMGVTPTRVLVLAYTGKAAALVKGVTIHSAFDFKFGTEHIPLSDQKLAQLRDLLSELCLIIIDEYSLLSVDLIYKLHQRLVEICLPTKASSWWETFSS